MNPGTHITVRGSIHGEVSIKRCLRDHDAEQRFESLVGLFYLSGANQSWIEQLYEDFLTDLTRLTLTGVRRSSSYLVRE